MLLILNVLFVLVAMSMIGLILMQRGAGAQAGSGFGAGASATVFGSRGASNFLSKSTKWLAVVFFGLTLFMAWYAKHENVKPQAKGGGASVTDSIPAAPAKPALLPTAPVPTAPAIPQGALPQPAVPTPVMPAPTAPAPAAPAKPAGTGG